VQTENVERRFKLTQMKTLTPKPAKWLTDFASRSGWSPTTRCLAGVFAGLLFASTSHAQFINGDIQFTGGATLDTGNLATATAFTQIFGPGGPGSQPLVLGGGTQTGSYASVPGGTQVTFQTFSFATSSPVVPLWTFTVGATTYSFDASTITVPFQNQFFLDIQGTGTAFITGFTPTAGTWEVTDTGVGNVPVFTFGAATDVGGSAPEPSTMVLLLIFMPAAYIGFRLRRNASNSTAK
jgi:hypothetical protein